MARTMLLTGAAGAAAAIVIASPPDGRLSAAAGCLIFGLYAFHERRVLRHLGNVLSRLRENEQGQHQLLTNVLETVRDQHAATQGISTRIDQVRRIVGRFDEMGKELSAMHGAATTEILTQLREQRSGLIEQLDRVERRLGHTQTELRRLHSEVLVAAVREFRQTEALLGLHSLFPVRAPLPPSRKWAASPDILLHLVSLVLDRRPRLVVELGSGLSTVWLSYAMERAGNRGRIISLDHDTRFASGTRALLLAHHLDGIAEVRDAPLTDLDLDGDTWPWYDRTALADIENCELLIVDGPPAATRDRARYPALPILAKRLSEHATVVLDDCIRQDEKDIVAQWRQRYPEWRVEMFDHEKGTAIFTR